VTPVLAEKNIEGFLKIRRIMGVINRNTMKLIKSLSLVVATLSLVAGPLAGLAADQTTGKKSDVKPYQLDKCMVSDEKLGEMGKPFVFDYKGQEIKLCCKSCKKDFDKNPEKFIKKMNEAQKKADPAKPKDNHADPAH
jgi:YHS domain-containing protein